MNGSIEIKKYVLSVLKDISILQLDQDFEKELATGVVTPISISKTSDILTIRKCHSFSDKNVVDLMMKFRIKRNGSGFELWPIYFTSVDGRSINAETVFRDKILINSKLQDELIELADTWGKALSAQAFARTLSNQI